MGKYKRCNVNPDKKKKPKGNLGPCGKEIGKRPCKKQLKNPKTNGFCKTSCNFARK